MYATELLEIADSGEGTDAVLMRLGAKTATNIADDIGRLEMRFLPILSTRSGQKH